MSVTNEGLVLRSAADLITAIKGMMMQMDRKQRKSFLTWVKERRNEYDFRFPQGFVPKDVPNEQNTSVIAGDVVAPTEPVSILTPQQPGIVNPQGEVVHSEDRGAGASA